MTMTNNNNNNNINNNNNNINKNNNINSNKRGRGAGVAHAGGARRGHGLRDDPPPPNRRPRPRPRRRRGRGRGVTPLRSGGESVSAHPRPLAGARRDSPRPTGPWLGDALSAKSDAGGPPPPPPAGGTLPGAACARGGARCDGRLAPGAGQGLLQGEARRPARPVAGSTAMGVWRAHSARKAARPVAARSDFSAAFWLLLLLA